MFVARKIGLGDLEHVRYSLLGVLFLGELNLNTLRTINAFASSLNMMARVHVNTSQTDMKLLDAFQHKNMNHQVQCWSNLDRGEFLNNVLRPVDLIVYGENIVQELSAVWRESGGRFTAGNHAKHDLEHFKTLRPDLFPTEEQSDKYWELWNV